jgi:MIP family channel proteins
MNSSLSKALVAEFIGTFVLIFIGAGSGVVAGLGIGNLVTVALAHGLVIVVFAYSYGHISGTHINPAVTLGLLTAGKIEPAKAISYIVVQLLGATLAGFLLVSVVSGINPPEGASANTALVYGVTVPNALLGITPMLALVLETIATFLLVNTVLNAAASGKAGNMAGLAIGMTLTFCIFFIGPLTGASLNPARTLGPSIAAGIYDSTWVYIVGPILGGVIAGVLYRYFLAPVDVPVAAPPVTARRK